MRRHGKSSTLLCDSEERREEPRADPRPQARQAGSRAALSGLDEVEITNDQLNMGRLQGPAGLIEALKLLVPDSTFDMEVTKISLPLPNSVRRRLNP